VLCQLCVVDRPDGKRNWYCINQYGKHITVPPKQVLLVLPGDGFTKVGVKRRESCHAEMPVDALGC
jgi:hypothetical protein